MQRLNAEVSLPVLDLHYYKIDYKHAWFNNFYKDFTFMLNGEIGYADSYGNKNYPFFKHFFMGGGKLSSRFYDNGSLGPRDIDPSTGESFAVGGTKRLLGNAELFMPVPGLKDSKQFRLSAFIDGGNVYDSNGSIGSDLRYSTGAGGKLGITIWPTKTDLRETALTTKKVMTLKLFSSNWEHNFKL